MDEAEARAQGLPGSDVFVRSHLAHRDPLNLAAMVLDLLREAFRAFTMTTFIIGREQRRVEGQATMEWFEGDMTGQVPGSPYTFHYLQYRNIENLLIGTGFELALKAGLLEAGYVVHKIKNEDLFKALAAKQRTEPIKADSLLAIEGYIYERQANGQPMNHLRGLSAKSLNFDDILNKPLYQDVLNLNSQTLAVINYFRRARNDIHLPGDAWDPPAELEGVDLTTVLIDFINKEVVDLANEQAEKHDLPAKVRLDHI